MKKLLVIFMTLLFVLSLSACKNKSEDEDEGETSFDYEVSISASGQPFTVDGTASFEVYISNVENGPVFLIVDDGTYASYDDAKANSYYEEVLKNNHTTISVPLSKYNIGEGSYLAIIYTSQSADAYEVSSIEFTVGNVTMYSKEYYESLYPEKTIKSFSFNVNGSPRTYYYAEEDIENLDDWLESEYNYDGWHYLDGDIVNEEETMGVDDDYVGEDGNDLENEVIINTYNYSYSADDEGESETEITRTSDTLTFSMLIEKDNYSAYKTITFNYKDENVVSINCLFECENEETANYILGLIKEDEDIEQSSVKQEGNNITCDMNQSCIDSFAGVSMDDLQELLEME